MIIASYFLPFRLSLSLSLCSLIFSVLFHLFCFFFILIFFLPSYTSFSFFPFVLFNTIFKYLTYFPISVVSYHTCHLSLLFFSSFPSINLLAFSFISLLIHSFFLLHILLSFILLPFLFPYFNQWLTNHSGANLKINTIFFQCIVTISLMYFLYFRWKHGFFQINFCETFTCQNYFIIIV